MRKIIYICITIFVCFTSLSPSSAIKNNAVPITHKDGKLKCLQLKRIFEIRDKDDSRYFFKHPHGIQVSFKGNIFVADQKQMIKFSAKGEFQKNYYVYGQGPAETISTPSFCLNGDRLILHDSAQSKILIFDTTRDHLLREFKVDKLGNHTLVYAGENQIFLTNTVYQDTKGKLASGDIDLLLFSVSYDGKQVVDKTSFSQKSIHMKSGDHVFSVHRSRFIFVPLDGTTAVISHTNQYRLNVYDLKKNTIKRTFTREYSRLRVTKETKKYSPGGGMGEISMDGKTFYKLPMADYHLDIRKILRYRNMLWVVTSTYNKENLVLIDVFDYNGMYKDRFYLKCPDYVHPLRADKWLQTIEKDKLYTVEEENGQKMIRVYRIGEFY